MSSTFVMESAWCLALNSYKLKYFQVTFLLLKNIPELLVLTSDQFGKYFSTIRNGESYIDYTLSLHASCYTQSLPYDGRFKSNK